MSQHLTITPEQPQEQKPRKRRTGLRVMVLLVLVAAAAALNYVDLGFLFNVPKNTAEVEIPETRPAPAEQPALPDYTAGAPQTSQPQTTLPESQADGAAAQANATRQSNATDAGAISNQAHNATKPAQNVVAGREATTVDVGGGRTAEVGAVIAPVKSDPTVTPRFITDLAEFLVAGYYPKGTHPAAGNGGISNISLKSLNMRYGGGLVGLNKPVDDPVERRRFVLQYVMMPSMIRALYALYADTFISTMAAEGAKLRRTPQDGQPRGLSPREQAEMFGIYSADVRTLSAIVRACAADREISKHVRAYWDAERATLDADLAFQNAQEARELTSTDGAGNVTQAKDAADKAGLAYRNAVIKRENARSALISVLRGHPGVRGLGDDQMLYAVAWVERRLNEMPNALNALGAICYILDNLAGRMEALSQAP